MLFVFQMCQTLKRIKRNKEGENTLNMQTGILKCREGNEGRERWLWPEALSPSVKQEEAPQC